MRLYLLSQKVKVAYLGTWNSTQLSLSYINPSKNTIIAKHGESLPQTLKDVMGYDAIVQQYSL